MNPGTLERAETGRRPPSWWKVAPGVAWIQVHCLEHARALARIRGGRRVAYSVAGLYLRTYEFTRTLRWAEGWANRRMARLGLPNEGFSELAGSVATRPEELV